MNDELMTRMEALPLEMAVRMGDKAFTEDEKAFIRDLYFKTTGRQVRKCACRHILTDAVMELRSILNIKRRKDMDYELKSGVLIWVDNNPYSNANLTDKIAERWCVEHPQYIEDYFNRYPMADDASKPLKPKKKGKK